LEFHPVLEGEEAGITVIMNEQFHYEIALTLLNGRRVVILRKRVGSIVKIENEIEFIGESIIFEIKAEPKNYIFSFYNENSEKVTLGTGECSLLSSEVAGGFTGVYFGLYASGNGKSPKSTSYFDWFDYMVNEQ
jgi:xylan 1,4-beta-xylosidase